MRAAFVGVVVLAVPALTLAAQTTGSPPRFTMPDSAQQARLAVTSSRMSEPAEFVLGLKVELGLTPEQVGLLGDLARSQRDSVPLRRQRMMTAIQATNMGGAASAMAWSGPLDEKAVRAVAYEQSLVQAEVLLNIGRDRRVVGSILTEAQRAMLPRLEAQAMMKAMKQP